MRSWSDSPFPQIIPLSSVEGYNDGDVLSRDNGESSVIYEIPASKGWLVKLYRPETKIDADTLSRLIAMPAGMSASDIALLDKSITWPVSRIVDGYRTVGSIMVKASTDFVWDIKKLADRTDRRTVTIDLLALPPQQLQRLGLPVPNDDHRLQAVRNIVDAAALFERHGMVYADWSFANAFWAPLTQATLIIDVDSCGVGQRPFVETPNWTDPLMRIGQPVTTHTDRYKVALLVIRALTGVRTNDSEALAEVAKRFPGQSGLADVLRRILQARSVEQRPTLADLRTAMYEGLPGSRKGGDNVTQMIPWQPRKNTGTPVSRLTIPAPQRTAPKAPPARRPTSSPGARRQSPIGAPAAYQKKTTTTYPRNPPPKKSHGVLATIGNFFVIIGIAVFVMYTIGLILSLAR
ncbi:hypothetical protein [Herbidospora mongoliensis]|uniref:hypothetical protein n=1 Tax=Herbidospora mongoliensis TaxID=688067 RepID=UPI000829668A|nr:hypothetical protein [Herbidospora mongoliensis]